MIVHMCIISFDIYFAKMYVFITSDITLGFLFKKGMHMSLMVSRYLVFYPSLFLFCLTCQIDRLLLNDGCKKYSKS